MRQVAALYVDEPSVYDSLPGVDTWPLARDANLYPGPFSVVAHPPCAGYCRLRAFARQDRARDACAFRARDIVREYGGVLEHPAFSSFWPLGGLPEPGARDSFGGITFPVWQCWFGHRARKATWLYVVGLDFKDFPAFPLSLAEPGYAVTTSRRGVPGALRKMGGREASATPLAFAEYLVSIARLVPLRGTLGGAA